MLGQAQQEGRPGKTIMRIRGSKRISAGAGTRSMRATTRRVSDVFSSRGRDAADVPISTTFGPNALKKFSVVTDELATAA